MFIAQWIEKLKPDCVIPTISKLLKFYLQNNLKITALQPELTSISKAIQRRRILNFATNLPKPIPIIINFYAVIFTESEKTLKREDPTDT